MRRALSFGLLVIAAACGRRAPKPRTLYDHWLLVRAAGKDAGYHHARAVQSGEIVVSTTETVYFIRERPRVQIIETEERAADGALLRLRVKGTRSAHESETDIRFDGRRAMFSMRVMEETRESSIDVPSDLRGPRWIERLAASHGWKPGAKVAARTFDADYGLVTVERTVVGEEEVELLDGARDRLVRVEVATQGLPRVRVEWVDAEGRPRKIATEAHGLAWETCVATEERAKRGATAPRPGVFRMQYLPVPHPIPSPLRIDRATYRVRANGDMGALADDRQSVERAPDGGVLLRIQRKSPPEGLAGRRPIESPPRELAAALAPSSWVQSDAPEILALAREIGGADPDAWKTARKFEEWVERHVPYDLELDFASALEVARDRHGDCSEHALLLCALCRAAGIPARCARGLFFADREWGLHLWVEVWIEGSWYALDGVLGWGSVGPSHVTLARRTFEDSAFPEATLARAPDILELDAVEVVLNGITLRAGEDPGRVEGDRYGNAAWGIGFPCPAGWRFRSPGPDDGLITYIARIESAAGLSIDVGALDTAGDDSAQLRAAAGWEKGARDSTVNGRPAIAARNGRRVYVLGAKGILVFDLAGTGADAKTLEAFLAGVDFDAKLPE